MNTATIKSPLPERKDLEAKGNLKRGAKKKTCSPFDPFPYKVAELT